MVGIVVERDFRLLRPKRGDTVHIGRVSINLVYETGRREVGESDTSGVPVAFFGEISDKYTEDRRFCGFRLKVLHHPADDIRIHTRTADIFTCPIHNEQIEFIKGQSSHQRFRFDEQFTFGLEELRRGHSDCFRGIFVRVLNQSDAESDFSTVEDETTDSRDNVLKTVLEECAVVKVRPFLFAKPDNHHLHHAALDRAVEICMCLNAIERNNVIRFSGIPIQKNGQAVCSLSEFHDLHCRFHRCTDGLFGDTVMFQHTPLSFGGCTTVASHRWNDKGLRTECFEIINSRLDRSRNIRNAATPRGNGDSFAGFDNSGGVNPFQFCVNRGGEVSENRCLKRLLNPCHFWKCHAFPSFMFSPVGGLYGEFYQKRGRNARKIWCDNQQPAIGNK